MKPTRNTDEDVTEVWTVTREVVTRKVKKLQGGVTGVETSTPDEKEVKRTFCLREGSET